MKEEGISEENDDSVVNIPISFDGTWSKRGYTANHGIGFVISAFNELTITGGGGGGGGTTEPARKRKKQIEIVTFNKTMIC